LWMSMRKSPAPGVDRAGTSSYPVRCSRSWLPLATAAVPMPTTPMAATATATNLRRAFFNCLPPELRPGSLRSRKPPGRCAEVHANAFRAAERPNRGQRRHELFAPMTTRPPGRLKVATDDETRGDPTPRPPPNLGFHREAEEAAEFYVSVFPNSRITNVSHYTEGSPRPAGSVLTVDFLLDGQQITAINGGARLRFAGAVSLS